ncbi:MULTISPECIES: hypothetical protein [Flavobacteriaceae]|uniref:hypothetical protein n=1 Tax=Flavobacteriaceae TaxID=49546 RepID=UPI0010AE64A8|nr:MULTISPECIES: hypothetical protein [Flavobacteriaceae]NJB35889.1 hypothetical protein [Croceivirga sp. JEA036]TKD65824.1 hypothetical protein FBT53_02865 [Flavobacterium sp. ASW18X]
MKRWIGFLGHLAIITILTSFASYKAKSNKVAVPADLVVADGVYKFGYPKILANQPKEETSSVFLGKSFHGFKEALAFKESRGDYTSINTLGYLGKYQFGAGTLRLMGVYDVDDFIQNPEIQERVFELNVARNKWILRRDIKRFVGKKINGTVITESGIVAAAHLAGAGNVKKYLRSYGQQDFADAYGSTIAYYIKKFAGFDVSGIKAVQRPKV